MCPRFEWIWGALARSNVRRQKADKEARTCEHVTNKLQDRIQERSRASLQERFGLWGMNRNGSGSR